MRKTRTPQSCLPQSGKKLVKGTVRKRPVPNTTFRKRKNRLQPSRPRRGFRPSRNLRPSLGQREYAKKDLFRAVKHFTCASTNNINSTNAGPKYYVDANIVGQEISMLLDTGSQVTLINESDCPADVRAKLAPPTVELNAYNGSKIDIRGVFETDICLGNIKIPKTMVYVTTKNLKPILGTPALSKLTIDFQGKHIRQNQAKCPIRPTSNEFDLSNFNIQAKAERRQRELYQLYSTTETIIPAQTEVILTAKIQNNFKGYGLFVTEPETGSIPSTIIAKSVSNFSPTARETIVRLCNISNDPVQIRARKPLVKTAAVEAIAAKNLDERTSDIMKDVRIGKPGSYYKKEIKDLLSRYTDVFAAENEPLGKTDAVEFDIDTGSSPPIAQQKYKTPYFLRNELKRIIDKNIANGLMEECSSPWAAPTLLVKKANGSWRLVCDYRLLNGVTTSDAYPLPEINECVNELADSTIFTSTDLFSGFHQIPTTEAAKTKLAVITDFGQYTWRRMPMGAKNCPSVFQRMMDKCFRKMPLSSLVIYLDDILLHSKDMNDHLSKLKELFEILRRNQLQIRADKTVIATNEVSFCGYRIKDGIKYPNEQKVQAVRALKSPKTAKESQMIFGLLNYHRSFIRDFAKKAVAITKTYNAKGRFAWTSEAEKALQILKEEICNAALQLKIPSLKQAKFVLETDACDSGFAGTLFICKNRDLHSKHNASCLQAVEYMSGQFTPAQSRYYIQEKELYAGKEAMRKWAHYLLGRPFDWQIDNACLKWAHRIKSTKMRISQWLAEISEFDARTILKPSSQMKVTDCLSRQFAEVTSISVSREDIRTLQENDQTIRLVRNFAVNNRWPNNPTDDIEFYKTQRNDLIFGREGELLLRSAGSHKLVIPECLTSDIIRTYHDDIGHPGLEKTVSEISSRYVWRTIKQDVKQFVQTCHECQISKPNLKPRHPPLGKSSTPTRPYEMFAFDLIGPLPVTDNNNKYGLVGLDLFSKRVYAVPLESKHSSLIKCEIEKILTQNPVLPTTVLTDNGTEFAEISDFCNELGIKHSKSAPYHPQTNGAVERMNQTLKQRLFEIEGEATWDTRLPRIVHAINCSRNAVTDISPFQLETGLEGQNLHDHIESPRQQPLELANLQRLALERIMKEKDTRIQNQENPSFVPFAIDDMVVTKNHQSKFPRFKGPFKITKVRGSGLSYELKEMDGTKTQIRSAVELKPYYMRDNIEPRPEAEEPTNDEPKTSIDFFEDEDFEINFFAQAPSQGQAPMQNLTPPVSETASEQPSSPDTTEPCSPSPSSSDAPQESQVDQSSALVASTQEEDDCSESSELENDNPNPDETDQEQELDSLSSGAEEIAMFQEESTAKETKSTKQITLHRKGQISPKPDITYKLKLYQMTTGEIDSLAVDLKIPINGNLCEKKSQIDAFFRQNHPQHARTTEGHLVFETTFNPTTKSKMKTFSTLELGALMSAYDLKQPSVFANKQAIYKHVKKQLLKKYPAAEMIDDDIVFTVKRSESPESNNRTMSLRSHASKTTPPENAAQM